VLTRSAPYGAVHKTILVASSKSPRNLPHSNTRKHRGHGLLRRGIPSSFTPLLRDAATDVSLSPSSSRERLPMANRPRTTSFPTAVGNGSEVDRLRRVFSFRPSSSSSSMSCDWDDDELDVQAGNWIFKLTNSYTCLILLISRYWFAANQAKIGFSRFLFSLFFLFFFFFLYKSTFLCLHLSDWILAFVDLVMVFCYLFC